MLVLNKYKLQHRPLIIITKLLIVFVWVHKREGVRPVWSLLSVSLLKIIIPEPPASNSFDCNGGVVTVKLATLRHSSVKLFKAQFSPSLGQLFVEVAISLWMARTLSTL